MQLLPGRFQACLLEDAIQSCGGKVIVARTGHCDSPGLRRMPVLVVAAATARKVPTIVEQESHDVWDFHLAKVGRVPQTA